MGSTFSSPTSSAVLPPCIIQANLPQTSEVSSELSEDPRYESCAISDHIIIEGEQWHYPKWRWSDGKVPYWIDRSIVSRPEILSKLQAAIDAFHTQTPIQLIEMQKNEYPDYYVTFKYHDTDCNSYLGRLCADQTVNIPDWAVTGNIMHEIMHTLGFNHEHSRIDRDQVVRVNPSSVKEGWRQNYLADGHPIGQYDKHSIMHYPTDNALRFIEKDKYWSANREKFSELDLKALRYIYGKPNCSYEIYGNEYFLQSYYECITCWGEDSCYGVCLYCSITCHKDHAKKLHSIRDLAKVNAKFLCDCGKYGHEKMLCTKESTGKRYVKQRMFLCWTCFDVKSYRKTNNKRSPGVCYPCSQKCHADHNIEDVGIIPGFFCDCGMNYCRLESGCKAMLNNLSIEE